MSRRKAPERQQYCTGLPDVFLQNKLDRTNKITDQGSVRKIKNQNYGGKNEKTVLRARGGDRHRHYGNGRYGRRTGIRHNRSGT